ncbi:hypothetical protein L1049_020610 [Liquidambar formosana]|uniref:VQ domain-containing protein n=1 Tax=Liquidambar formosana TaxID=63359 RepID=A0AAP0S863_LIQFO
MEMGKRLRDHQNTHHLKSRKATKVEQKPTKITYISNPITVKACSPFEFRTVVQELTGKNSDVRSPGDTGLATITDEASWVLDHETPQEKLVNENVEDGFLNTIYSHEMDDEGFLWGEVLESLSGFQSPSVFV